MKGLPSRKEQEESYKKEGIKEINEMGKRTFKSYKKCSVPVYQIRKNAYPTDTGSYIPIAKISENGVFQIEPDNKEGRVFDKMYRFTDINFDLEDDEGKRKVLQVWMEILRGMKVAFKVMVSGIERSQETVDRESRREPLHEGPIYVLTNEALNEVIGKKRKLGNNRIDYQYYLILSCVKQHMEEAVLFFNNLETSIVPYFYQLESELIPVDGINRLGILKSIYRPLEEERFSITWEKLREERDYFRHLLAPLTMEIEKKQLRLDARYGCVLLAREYPESLPDGFLTKFVKGLNFPVIATMDFSPLSKSDTKEMLSRKLMNIEGSIDRQQQQNNQRGAFLTDPSWDKRQQKQEISDELENAHLNDEVYFYTSLLIYVEGESQEELDSRVERVKQQAAMEDVELEVLRGQQVEAFQTILPTAARLVPVLRPMKVSSITAFCPYHVAELNDRSSSSAFYGINQGSKTLIFANKKNLKNGNGFIYAPPGSGKSFFVKLEIVQVLNYTYDDVLILDPANEYFDICEFYGGQVINFSNRTETHINPLWIPEDVYFDESLREGFISDKGVFMQRLFPYIKKKTLEGNEATYIDRSVRRLYEDVFRIFDEQGIMEEPTFLEYQRFLAEEPREKAGDILDAFELYVSGSSNVFAHKSNVDINSRMVVFGIRDLGETLKKPSMMIITELMTTRLTYNKRNHKATRVYGDELHVVFDDPEFALAWEKLWKVARKDGGITTGITQNISDSIMSKQAKTMVANSDVIGILSLSKTDRQDLPEIIDLTDTEMQYVDAKHKGMGLMKFGNTKVIFDARIDQDNILYWLFTTDPKESRQKQKRMKELKELIAKKKEEVYMRDAKEREQMDRNGEASIAKLREVL